MRADRYRVKRGLGLALFILSFVFYGFLLLLPLTDLSAESKIAISAALVILGEASFWLSVLILGREAIAKYRKIDWRARLSRLLKKV